MKPTHLLLLAVLGLSFLVVMMDVPTDTKVYLILFLVAGSFVLTVAGYTLIGLAKMLGFFAQQPEPVPVKVHRPGYWQ